MQSDFMRGYHRYIFLFLILITPGVLQQCGTSDSQSELRMVQGTVPSNEHPARYNTVALVKSMGKRSFCSGSIIADRLILTAAHCIDGKTPSNTEVMFGLNADDPDVEYVKIEEMRAVQNEYKYGSNYDLAWLRLSEPVPAPYHSLELLHDKSLIAAGTEVTIAGFGKKASRCGFDDPSCNGGDLQYVETNVREFVDQGRLYNLMVVDSGNEKGPCFGDSGGPLYVQHQGQWFIAGDFMGWDKILVPEDPSTICDNGQGIYNFAGDFANWIEASSGLRLQFDALDNPRPLSPEDPWLAEDDLPANFIEWCEYRNFEDPAWYTVQRLIRILSDDLFEQGNDTLALQVMEECTVADRELAAYFQRHDTLKLIGRGPEFNFKSAVLRDIRPLRSLQGLPIKRLILTDHDIKDLSPINGFSELEYLEIADNRLAQPLLGSDEGASAMSVETRGFDLSALVELRELSINNVNVAIDFSGLRELSKLESLTLTDASLRDLDFLANKPLRELRLENVAIESAAFLPALASLKTLELKRVNVKSIDRLPALRELRLWDLPDIKSLQLGLSQNLTTVILYNLGLESLQGLGGLGALEQVSIISNESLQAVDELSYLPNLDRLEVMNNALPSLVLGKGLNSLRELLLSNNNLLELSVRGSLPALEIADLRSNALQSLPELSALTPALQSLNLSFNPLDESDLVQVSGLQSLNRLAIENNKGEGLQGLSALENLPALLELNLKGNSLQSLDNLVHISQLEVILASDNYITDVSRLGVLTQLQYLELVNNPIDPKVCPLDDERKCRFEWMGFNF